MAGYSGTPLVKKLGIKSEMVALVRNSPIEYPNLVKDIPASVTFAQKWRQNLDFVHLFATKQSELIKLIERARKYINPAGMIWVSWPKKASKMPTDITEDVVRNFALSTDLVDIKVCAIDDVWSGLKLVIRKENR